MGSFIIVFRNSHRDPFISVDSMDFKETYSSFEVAKEVAEEIIEQQGPKSEWYFDYSIYEEVDQS